MRQGCCSFMAFPSRTLTHELGCASQRRRRSGSRIRTGSGLGATAPPAAAVHHGPPDDSARVWRPIKMPSISIVHTRALDNPTHNPSRVQHPDNECSRINTPPIANGLTRATCLRRRALACGRTCKTDQLSGCERRPVDAADEHHVRPAGRARQHRHPAGPVRAHVRRRCFEVPSMRRCHAKMPGILTCHPSWTHDTLLLLWCLALNRLGNCSCSAPALG